MESFEIGLDPALINLLHQPKADIAVVLNTLFAPASANYQKLILELQREFRQHGSPDVTRIAFDRAKHDAAKNTGSFRVLLDVQFSFGCEDSVTDKKDQTSEWTFAVNLVTHIITFCSSPFVDARSTADEF